MRIAVRHAIVILIIMAVVLAVQNKNRKTSECGEALPQVDEVMVQSSQVTFIEMAQQPKNVQSIKNEDHEIDSNDNLTAEQEKPGWALLVTAQERYELAKIMMCEAEGEGQMTKALIVFTVMNRVEDSSFPDNIHDVIFEEHNGIYQFSPLAPNGSWHRKEPNEECYRVLDMILDGAIEDTSEGALYFEACTDADNWHSRNLEYLFDSDNTRFYK